MLCIIFYLNLRLKYVIKYIFLFFINIRGYMWILKNYTDTRKTNTQLIWIREYGTNVYSTGRVQKSYYPQGRQLVASSGLPGC